MSGKILTPLNVLVTGFTGATGKLIVQQLAESDQIFNVICVGRRLLDVSEYPFMNRVEQRLADFNCLPNESNKFQGANIHICCLGSTLKEAKSVENRRKVDFDMVREVALHAKNNGCKHFNLITSIGADSNSFNSYLKAKGEIEEEVRSIGFQCISIYRPAFLIAVKRKDSRLLETLTSIFAKPVECLLPGKFTTNVPKMAHKILNNIIRVNEFNVTGVEILTGRILEE
ncbi:hypothetical protein GJ496_006897 [Pomphorhynchus laevis]|nr:hypothetical protein GJ496_006897 [Pomphorhynchus laevis]